MKRSLYILISLFVLVILAACGREQTIDYRSILDTETGHTLSLGDSRADIERALGDYTFHVESDRFNIFEYTYALRVIFEDDVAVAFFAGNASDSDRFELLGYRIGMTREDAASNFQHAYEADTEGLMIAMHHFDNFYDAQGNLTDEANAFIQARLGWVEPTGAEGRLITLFVGYSRVVNAQSEN